MVTTVRRGNRLAQQLLTPAPPAAAAACCCSHRRRVRLRRAQHFRPTRSVGLSLRNRRSSTQTIGRRERPAAKLVAFCEPMETK
ncbi:unnamed protein product [Macrosiphum euphorbiae]|uniref:Secreted protein n=1 Tax=Macrosiphum euphorbiae TaxID=13131 RepID=A0AAV0XC81_9HEMI|nr:unnamed protein product [Macrosiphum euphorbiae]